jgi:ubiquinone/menaquinone biosynthesis C-methylase UbiE
MTATSQETSPAELQQNPAQLYESHLVTHMFRPFARDLVARAAPQPGERVLDIACGTGVVARLIAPLVGPSGSVTGLDLNPGMLAVARECAEAEGMEITWQSGNAITLPFTDGAFDLVVCHQGLQFFSDKTAALREMRRVLAPSGRALVSSWSPVTDNPVNQIFDEIAVRKLGFTPGAVPFGLGGANVLEAYARESGFVEVSVASVGLTVRWPSYAEFLQRTILGAVAAVPALAAMSPEVRADLIRAYADEATSQISAYLDGEALNTPLQTDIAIARP